MAPLPINFHRSFKPERRHLGALLRYAALGHQGTYQEIAAETGIPTGMSSGKVGPTLDYATAMGLVEPAEGRPQAVKRPVLTLLGRVVYSTDPYLSQEVTQWLVHMNLCRGDQGAAAWHAVFARGRQELGSSFTKLQLEAYLVDRFGPGNQRTGPLITTYTDDDALGGARILVEQGDRLVRRKAPVLDAYAIAYSGMILALMNTHFCGQGQVTFSDFNKQTRWFDICLWEQSDEERVFLAVERRAYVSVDRQRRPWIVERNASLDDVWPHIYDDLA